LNDNILQVEREPAAQNAPAQTAEKGLYPLDWETTVIKLKEGRFKHRLRRPTAEEIYAREEDLQREIPIGKDGSFSMPDPTANEETDAEYYDKLVQHADGYKGDVPAAHKAAAFQGLYVREIYIDDDTDVFADEVPVLEEYGSNEEPDFTIVHVMRQPAEAELKRYRRRSSQGEVKPGKRGKQRFVSRSTLKNAVEHYDMWCVDIKGAKIGEADFKFDISDLKAAVDPLIKRQVVQTLADAVVGNLLD
jgi:hypothetical protein